MQDARLWKETVLTTSSGCRHLPMPTASSTTTSGRMEGKEVVTCTLKRSQTHSHSHLIRDMVGHLEYTISGQRKLPISKVRAGRVLHSHGLVLPQAWGGSRHPPHFTDIVQGCKHLLLWTYLSASAIKYSVPASSIFDYLWR